MADTMDLPMLSSSAVIELIGGYAVLRQLRSGGAADVFACRDQELGRDVALKVLREELLVDDVAVERFRREGRVLARIASPHVVSVYHVGVHGKVPYIVMELVDGSDAESVIADSGAFDLGRALDIARQVALALAAAHDLGVLHRDVKPANILLTNACVKLTDFGLAAPVDGSARLTQVGTIPGTAAFLPPERVRGQHDDARSDIYALGCTLYTLIAGRPPFERESPIGVIAAHVHEPAPRLRGRADVADLVEAMLAKDPTKRPQTAASVAELIAKMQGNGAKVPAARRDALMNEIEKCLAPAPLSDSPAPPRVIIGDASTTNAAATRDASLPVLSDVMAAPASTRAPAANAAAATGVTGSLARMGLAELLQTVEHASATACIDLRSSDGEGAMVALLEGRLVHARQGDIEGKDAFFALMRWRNGSFQIHYDRPPPNKNLDAAPQALMLEAFRRLDEGSGPPVATPPAAPPSATTPAAAPGAAAAAASLVPPALRVDLERLRARARLLVEELPRRAPHVAAAGRTRWEALSLRRRAMAGAGALAVFVLVLVATTRDDAPAVQPNGVTIDRRAERVAAGEAREVLREVNAIPKAERVPADELLRGHALAATGDNAGAVAAYRAAAQAGAVDETALAFLSRAINEHPADEAMAALVAWPNDDIVSKLQAVVETGEWWERHHALVVLEKRKQADDVDVTALGMKDLKTGPTCAKRKHGMTILRDAGRGQAALRAIDEAQRRQGNNCISWVDFNQARAAVSRRGQTR